MKSLNRGAAVLCGIFLLGSSAYADQLQDNISEPQALVAGDTMTGQFVANTTLIDLNNVNGATLALTLADDGEATTPTTGESNTNTNTYANTINGVRTVTKTITQTAYFIDEEMDSVQILFGNQTQDATIEGGTTSFLGEETIVGPTPVPADQCNNTFGFFTSCANVLITKTYYDLSGYTGENIVYVKLDDAALQTFKQTGTVDYTVTATLGDLSVKNAILDVSVEAGNVTLDAYEPQSLDGMSIVSAVNNAGVVVGQIDETATADGWPHAAVWDSGTVTDLGMEGCRETVSFCWSAANGINNQGQIVGESFRDLSWPSQYFGPWSMYYAHEVIWQDANTQMEFMHTVGWEYGQTLDINAQGHAVGHGRSVDWQTAHGDYFVHGYLWRSNTDVVEFGEYGQASKAFALNDSDQVVGEINTNGSTQAFFWENDVLTTLGHFGGGSSTAVDINNNGQVVGSARNSAGQWRAFMWQGGFLYELAALPDTVSSRALAINDSGLIVGEMDGRAVAWKSGQLIELNDLVDVSYGLQLTKAVAINNVNQIVATTGGNNGYHLLSNEQPPEADVYVCADGCDATSIQDGINLAPGGVIVVYPGTYNENIYTWGGETLLSWKGPEQTIIDAQGSGVVVNIGGGTIDGFTIQGGSAPYGAGVQAVYATVKNNIITNNHSSGYGGGITLFMATMTGNTVSNNSAATFGGGVSLYYTSTMSGNTITNNSAGSYGGGVASDGSSFVDGNTFIGNSATNGGGLAVSGWTRVSLSVTGNRFKDNVASNAGGGVYVPGYQYAQVKNSIFDSNSAVYGGGLYVSSYGGLSCNQCTIYGNTATSGYGGGMYNPSYASQYTMKNGIAWGNNGGQVYLPRYGNKSITNSIIEGTTPGTNLADDPLFVDAENGDFRLSAGSPAIDSGVNLSAYEITTDIDGNVRPADGDGLGAGTTGDGSDYDMGAYEYQ